MIANLNLNKWMLLYMTMAVKKLDVKSFQNQILKDDKGQALMEFVLFLPFMMMMFLSILSISNSINGSINQQKIVRGYFYYRASNNSTIPRPSRTGSESSDGWQTFGMQIIGWAERFQGNTPVAPCYKFQLPFADDTEDSCEAAYSTPQTQFIRVQSVYGICGATYTKGAANHNERHPLIANPTQVTSGSACLLVN
jgi:hypothetical protein